MTTPIVSIDTETTGLDRRSREIWEVGLIRREAGTQYEWVVQVSDFPIHRSDPKSLEIGGFYARYAKDETKLRSEYTVAKDLVHYLAGAHLIGAVPSFEDTGLFKLLDRYQLINEHGTTPWHYHLIDVEAMAAGYIAGRDQVSHLYGVSDGMKETDLARPPWNSNDLSRAVGVDPDQFDRHTALGDARWALAIYDAIVGA